MKIIKHIQMGFFGVLFVSVFGLSATFAQTYSGQAFTGGVTVKIGSQPVVTTNVLDTGDLPPTGGNVTQSSVGLYTLPGGVLTLGDRTSSAIAPAPPSNGSVSFATVNDVNLGALGINDLVEASVVRADTSAVCPGSVLTGSSTITDLVVNGSGVSVGTDPNQEVTVNLGSGRLLKVVINEQILGPRSITVNALHVTITDPANFITIDVIVSSARSGINCVTPPLIDMYSGRGTAVRVDQNSLVIPFLSTIIADTGPLPAPGGALESTTDGAAVNPILTSGTVFSSTQGGNPVGTSSSHSEVEDLNVVILNPLFPFGNLLTLSADTLQSDTICQCSLGVPTCSGDSDVLGLTATVLGIPVSIPLDFVPNTTLVNVNLPGLATLRIIVNEQFASPGNITVNALHVELGALTNLLIDTDITVAHAHSDVVCGTIATAAPVSLSGRVVDPNGRGISSVLISITDGAGFTKSVRTNNFGYYMIRDIPSGSGYIVGAAAARTYKFAPRFVMLNDDLAGFDFSPEATKQQTLNKGPSRLKDKSTFSRSDFK